MEKVFDFFKKDNEDKETIKLGNNIETNRVKQKSKDETENYGTKIAKEIHGGKK